MIDKAHQAMDRRGIEAIEPTREPAFSSSSMTSWHESSTRPPASSPSIPPSPPRGGVDPREGRRAEHTKRGFSPCLCLETSHRAGDGNRTRVLSLGSEPGRLQILAYGPESLRFQESSDSR